MRRRLLQALVMIILSLSMAVLLRNTSITASAAGMVDKGDVYLVKGDSITLKAPSSKDVIWTSSNKKIVTVTKKGKISAKSSGTVVVTAKEKGKTYRYKVIILEKGSIKLSAAYKNILIFTNMKIVTTSDQYSADEIDAMKLNYKVISGDAIFTNGYVTSKKEGKFEVAAYLHGKKIASLPMKATEFKAINEKIPVMRQNQSVYISLKDIHCKLEDLVYTIENQKILSAEVETVTFNDEKYVDKIKLSSHDIGRTYLCINAKYNQVVLPITVGLSPVQAVRTKDYEGYSPIQQTTLMKVREVCDENNLFSSALSDREKIRALENYLVVNTVDDENRPIHGYISSLMLGSRGNCRCYAMTICFFCDLLDIPCYYVTGLIDVGNGIEKGTHAWNRVQLDGKWYYIDPTWAVGLKDVDKYYLTETIWEDHIITEEKLGYDENDQSFPYSKELD